MGLQIKSVNGSVVGVSDAASLGLWDTVYVGHERLIGEVAAVDQETAMVQVYESTTGLQVGMPVEATNAPMSLKLGPGLLGSFLDGIGRPLDGFHEAFGAFLPRGAHVDAKDKLWQVSLLCKEGDTVTAGQIFATVQETAAIVHRCLVPPHVSGKVKKALPSGEYNDSQTILQVQDASGTVHDLALAQNWPIRRPRPIEKRLPIEAPLITGQRIMDTLFPLGKGGAACIPGPFGAGKTITQHQLAKWADADIVVYIGCGERGNEMTQALQEFSHLTDPKTGNLLLARTVLIANTSNMPVASREASIYTGVTIAEYYRDMGYDVAMMADSTSRWAEALREISGRLEEMPAEEGYPAYLPSRLAEFYERAGRATTLSGKDGSITIIGAVSPQGSDFSEPVTQNTKRFTRTFWALDRSLAYARHFPSVNWNTSYSEYLTDLAPWYEKNVGKEYLDLRHFAAKLLADENRLLEIVRLIGADILPDDQKLILESAKLIRIGFLQQNAYHDIDTFSTIEKQKRMLLLYKNLFEGTKKLIAEGVPLSAVKSTGIFEEVIRAKTQIANDALKGFDDLQMRLENALSSAKAQAAKEA